MFRKRSLVAALVAVAASASGAAAFEVYDAGYVSRDSRTQVASLGDFYAPQRQEEQNTRVVVADPTRQKAGGITVDTRNRYLYLSLGDGRAIRYGVGVGRAGFTWSGNARIGRKAAWPSWTPPAEMLKRRPDLPRFMEGGIENP
ncbi:MAG TPA: L,D-transpeptidase, partial [Beijerinckiaceae bacterium]